MAEHGVDHPFTVLTEVLIEPDHQATERLQEYENANLGDFGRFVYLMFLRHSEGFEDLQMVITNDLPRTKKIHLIDSKSGVWLKVTAICRKIGEDTGRDTLYYLGDQVSGTVDHLAKIMKPLSSSEKGQLKNFLMRESE